MSNQLKENLIQFSKQNHIDLIGFAAKDRFKGLDGYKNPFAIFPEGKTVILVGKRICRGSLRGIEEGSNFFDYNLFGGDWLEDQFLASACYDLTRAIENEGYEAVPIFPNPVEVHGQGVPVKEGKEAPNVTPDFQYAAVACGLGEISYTGLIFTPQYGSRQRFHMVITDAELESDPILEGRVCDRCKKCAEVCPLGAISGEETVTICGKTMTVGKIDYSICKKCANGCRPNRLISSAKPDLIPALCNRVCLTHLEEQKLVGNRFENGFRYRDAWAKDIMGKNVKSGY